MAAKNPTVGIQHVTVVPTNYEPAAENDRDTDADC